jgi:hypothetical protein
MNEYNEIIKQTRNEIHALSTKQEHLFDALKVTLPELTPRAEDFLFDYIFNNGYDYSFDEHLRKIFGKEIPFDIFKQ